MSDRKKHSIRIFAVAVCCMAALVVTGCSSVFKAGVSGKVVDAESTSSPKAGIANVQVYAYTKEADRNSDYNAYIANPTGRFQPSTSSYIGKTTTGDNGSFVVNKLVWESMNPQFGKTADYNRLYLLFYHEDYGLYKNTGDVVVVSDSNNSDTVYEELTKIRKTTAINLTIRDVATELTGAPVNTAVKVTVKVPQSASANPDYIVYDDQTITGTGTITVTYPRYVDPTATPKVFFEPTVTISLAQSSDEITWKQAYNYEEHGDPPATDYAFYRPNEALSKKISGNSMNVNAYMKATRLSYSSIEGRVELDGSESASLGSHLGKYADDDISVWLGYRDAGTGNLKLFSNVSASVVTASSGNGANGSLITHGTFTGLGSGMTWDNDTYTERFLTKEVYVVVDVNKDHQLSIGDYYLPLSIRSDEPTKNATVLTKTTMTEITTLPVNP